MYVNRKLFLLTFAVLVGFVFVFALAAQNAVATPDLGSNCTACHPNGIPTPKSEPKQEAPKQEAPKPQPAPQQQQQPAAPKPAAPAVKAPAYTKVSLAINNNKMEVFIIDNYSLLPARELGSILGADVAWDGETQGITFTAGDKSVTVYLDKVEAKVNGSDAKAPVKAQSIDGTNVVPVRFVAEGLGFTVHYTGDAIAIYQ